MAPRSAVLRACPAGSGDGRVFSSRSLLGDAPPTGPPRGGGGSLGRKPFPLRRLEPTRTLRMPSPHLDVRVPWFPYPYIQPEESLFSVQG